MSRLPAQKRRRLTPPEQDEETVTNNFYQNASQWNLEEAYEKRAKKLKGKDKKNDRLPIKTREGVVEQAKAEEQVAEEKEEEDDGSEDGSADEEAAAEEADEPAEPEKPLREQILEAKEELAKIASMISEDPEEHISQLKNLAKLNSNRHHTIRQLAMATQVAVFKDIIPGYRIRPLGDENPKEKLSRDIKRLRHFEQTLVGCYKEYLTTLARAVKAGSRDPTPAQASVSSMAVSCTCTLLEAVPHFNFRTDLLNIIVSKLSSRSVDKDFVKCREGLETLFQNDEDGNSSLEAVTLLTEMMKKRDYNIHETVLNTFLHLRLLSEYSFRASTNHISKEDESVPAPKLKKKERQFRTKRERKLAKERKVVAAEMREADAVVSHEERDANQSEMLKKVFVAYFRILKQRKPHLMGAVLEGLARYAHLINQDFFGDVLESLRDLITTQELYEEDFDPDTPTRDLVRESLLCIVTASALLQGQDVLKSTSALHLDLSFFSTKLYQLLLPLSLDPAVETTVGITQASDKRVNAATPAVLLLRALSATMVPKGNARAVPPTLLAAYTKRLMTASLALPEKAALAVLALLKAVMRVHGPKIASLWHTEERRGDGVFDIHREDVESANPFAATVWEGEVLKMHYSPKVREAAAEVTEGVHKARN